MSKYDKGDFVVTEEGKKAIRNWNATTRIPEEMTVGELNQAVRDLREQLYQQKLRTQQLEATQHTCELSGHKVTCCEQCAAEDE